MKVVSGFDGYTKKNKKGKAKISQPESESATFLCLHKLWIFHQHMSICYPFSYTASQPLPLLLKRILFRSNDARKWKWRKGEIKICMQKARKTKLNWKEFFYKCMQSIRCVQLWLAISFFWRCQDVIFIQITFSLLRIYQDGGEGVQGKDRTLFIILFASFTFPWKTNKLHQQREDVEATTETYQFFMVNKKYFSRMRCGRGRRKFQSNLILL